MTRDVSTGMKATKAIYAAVAAFAAAVSIVSVGTGVANAEPGHGDQCLLPSVSECRLVPDGDGPHMVQQFCPDTGSYVSVFAPCPGAVTGPYS